MPDAKRRPGRPTIYTPAILEMICSRLAEGEPLRSICKDPALPARSTINRWIARSRMMARIKQALILEGLVERAEGQ